MLYFIKNVLYGGKMKKTLYDILEVSEKASKEVIDKAYKVLAKKYHPDLQTEENKSEAESIMKEINEAYNVLSDDIAREKYDAELANAREIEKQENLRRQQEMYSNVNANMQNTQSAQGNINSDKDLQRSMQEALKKQQENYRMQQEAYAKQQAEMEKQYNNAYYKYLKSLGYKVKFKWTWKQYLMLLIVIVVLIVIGLILWIIPPTHNWMLNLYNDNIFVKTIVNVVIGIFNGIGQMISNLFNN